MKPSTSGKFPVASSSSKTKKSTKDREKRKSQSTSEPTSQTNSDKGSPNKDSYRKYAGYGPEQLSIMAEQSIFEHLTEDVCLAFTEDLNYKLRLVIYDAVTRARLCGRNTVVSSDVDDAFDCLQIPKVYGASSSPEWDILGEHNLFYLEDPKVNLVELAEEVPSFLQPIEPVITRKWLPEIKDISQYQKNYFELMCQAVMSHDTELRLIALRNISDNNAIGPLIEWFYHFGYFILSKDITYDSLTLLAFDLIEALESNPISPYMVSDKQIMLLARLLLQRLLRCGAITEILKPMCRILAILCERIPVRKVILKKIVSKFPELRDDFPLPVLCAANELGLDAIYAIIIPHIGYLLEIVTEHEQFEDEEFQPEAIYEILRTYNILCKGCHYNLPLFNEFYNAFGDGLVQLWKHCSVPIEDSPKTEYPWCSIRAQLLKSRRRITYTSNNQHKIMKIEEAFVEDHDDDDDFAPQMIKTETLDDDEENYTMAEPQNLNRHNITFKFHSFAPAVGRIRFLNLAKYPTSRNCVTQVVIGKRTLLAPVLTRKKCNDAVRCVGHTLMYHNL